MLIASCTPFRVENIVSGTCGVDLKHFVGRGVAYNELQPGALKRKEAGSDEIISANDKPDTAIDIRNEICQPDVHMIFTSGHATESGWEIDYTAKYKSKFSCREDNQLYAISADGTTTSDVIAPTPKVPFVHADKTSQIWYIADLV
eukprot:m.183277 g.183277  ORF g.183277 m.183277 type:complete len:146 (-) comp18477_c0_seq5:884-1321(-)